MKWPKLRLSRERAFDWAIGWGLGLGYLVLLLLTARALGYSRDEGFYFQAADTYGRWFELLFSEPADAVRQVVVDRYWSANHEHPALIKSLFWASHEYLRGLPLIDSHGTAYRFPAMVLSALCVMIVYAWGRGLARPGAGAVGEQTLSVVEARVVGLVAAVSFAVLPQVFYHAHVACFDMPVTAMWVLTSYAYWRSTQRFSWRWTLGTAVLYGLLLNTKHNSWILPGALFLHLLVDRILGFRGVKLTRLGIPASWLSAALIAPLVFVGTWPWIWFDTYRRLREYANFHMGHVYYNMEFLGQTYFEAPMPRAYAWVMTLATVPTITLTLFAVGLLLLWRRALWPGLSWRVGHSGVGLLRVLGKATSSLGERWRSQAEANAPDGVDGNTSSTLVLWLVCIVASYAPWFSVKAPIFGGTKHWLTAYPYVCLLGAYALVAILRLGRLLPLSLVVRRVGNALSVALVMLVPAVIALGAHPWGLAAYVPLVGGAPGAASLGLNRSFWGYTTASVAPYLDDNARKNARVFVHDTALQSWDVMAKDDIVRSDLRPKLSVEGTHWAIYHHEQHMSRVEFMIWVDYGTTAPVDVATYDGVPVVWLYQRPDKEVARPAHDPDESELQPPAGQGETDPDEEPEE